jgi:hypothetical protein
MPQLSGDVGLKIPSADSKCNTDAPATEASILLEIAQNDTGRALVGDRQLLHLPLESKCQGGLGQ